MDHTAIDTGHHRLSIWTIIGASSTIDFGRQVGSARRAKDRIRRNPVVASSHFPTRFPTRIPATRWDSMASMAGTIAGK
jgi:hypothetical protein